uniref:SANT domain-containing protein n=1 Tax=Pectinophora gossypiella TaxID=13191 RepID=A0A1E1WHD2_PECGO
MGEDSVLSEWSKAEKYELLRILKQLGSHDIAAMQVAIPTKTSEQIQEAITYYKLKAYKVPSANGQKRKQKSDNNARSSLPLSNWAEFLTNTFTFEELQTEIAVALRIIADCSDIPPAACTDGVDYRKAYLLLANAVEGKPLPADKYQLLLINKCVLETALLSKAFIRNPILRHIIENMTITDQEVKNFPRIAASNELSTLLHLACQKKL